MAQIWVIDDDQSIRWVLEKAMQRARLSVECFASADLAMMQLRTGERPRVVFSDIRMPGTDGLELAKWLKHNCPDIPVVIMTAFSDLESAVASFDRGAFEYLPKPFDIDDAVALARRALDSRQDVSAEAQVTPLRQAPGVGLIGEAPAMQEVFRAIGRLARAPITVLVTGESGTGKELIAKALHRHSPRASAPFVALNMAAIPHELLESELFGHERGAFTGAHTARTGRFEQADGGTLFLDEIGDMPASLQTRLLRVLAEGQFYRVGGHAPVTVDVRIIAATHQDLRQHVARGDFREDLFHRLNVVHIAVPPLRARPEDVELLLCQFLDSSAAELDTLPKRPTPRAMAHLQSLPWPGNVRQLQNLARWLTVMTNGPTFDINELPPDMQQCPEAEDSAEHWEASLQQWAEQALQRGQSELLQNAQPRFERVLLRTALKHAAGKRIEAANLLGWGRNTITRKIRELELDGENEVSSSSQIS